MTTTAAGGKITGLLALTFKAASGVTLNVGDFVEVTGNYEVNRQASGSKPLVGVVTVANKARIGGTYPNGIPGGDVTVDVPGFMVRTVMSSAAITAGTRVGIDQTNQKLKVAGSAVANIGIALNTVAGADLPVDVLIQGF